MRVEPPLSFSVNHVGRGGDVACRCGAGEIQLAIELEAGGAFSVYLRGARLTSGEGKTRRLRPEERKLVLEELQRWLAATGRSRWAIER